MSDIFDFRRQLYETALSAGIHIISDDACCKILAWLYIYGGGNEDTVFNARFNTAIGYAQKRLKIDGGEFPDRLIFLLQKYVKSITDFYNPPEWVSELEAEYQITAYRKKLFGGVE